MSRFVIVKRFIATAILMVCVAGVAMGQTIDVTLQLNTATCPDTLKESHFAEVRGALGDSWATGPVLPGGVTISWDTSSDLNMTNVGGDYWEVTFEINIGDTLKYKFWTAFEESDAAGTQPSGGWEGAFIPVNPIGVDTRTFIAGANDTICPVQYYHQGDEIEQMWKPFEEKPDTIAIYFRVNLAGADEAGYIDVAAANLIGVRGDDAVSGGIIDWGTSNVEVTQEDPSIPENMMYSGVAYIPKDALTVGSEQAYKFVTENGDVAWEGVDNRTFTYSDDLVNTTGDTTLHWVWFNDMEYTGTAPVTSIITWRVSTEALEALGLFDRGVGDAIVVRGPRGWGSDDAIVLSFSPLLQEWTSTNEEFTTIPGTVMSFKYYIAWDSTRIDETSANYIPVLELGDNGYEEPSVTGGSNRLHTFVDAAQQFVVGDWGFDRQFFDGAPANSVIDHDIAVTWNVDMTNAADAGMNAGTLFNPGVDSVWVRWDGELVAYTQGLPKWDENCLELTDPDADMIYSGTFPLVVSADFPNVWYKHGYRIAYSTDTPGAYITNGGGMESGRRYYQYIHPTEIQENPGGQFPITVWPDAYDLPVVDWTEDNLYVEDPPDLTTPTGVGDDVARLPYKFDLSQNYPNPFNPETVIEYEIAKSSEVTLKIYNVMGQEVKTLVNIVQNTGKHSVIWDGKNAAGDRVTSGIYLLKMKAGDFTKLLKMTLIR
jgi:hypothetical protein